MVGKNKQERNMILSLCTYFTPIYIHRTNIYKIYVNTKKHKTYTENILKHNKKYTTHNKVRTKKDAIRKPSRKINSTTHITRPQT